MPDDPIRPELRKTMNDVGRTLDQIFNKGKKPAQYGFMLLVFDFNTHGEGFMNYLSNADRADMLTAMKEFIARNEGRVIDAEGHA